jgi:hypothetical protein
MRAGTITAELDADLATEEAIMRSASLSPEGR